MVHSSMPSWIGITWQRLNLYALIINTEQAFLKKAVMVASRRVTLEPCKWHVSHCQFWDAIFETNLSCDFQLDLSHLAQSAKQIVSFWQALLGKLSFFRQKPVKNGFKAHKKITKLPRTGSWHPPTWPIASLCCFYPQTPWIQRHSLAERWKELKLKRQSLGVLVQAFERLVVF